MEVKGGTRAYQAPELFKMEAKFTKKCDVYAAGVVFLEIVTLMPPLGLKTEFLPLIIGKGLPSSIETCLTSFLSDNPKDRPHFAQSLKVLQVGKSEIDEFAKKAAKFEKFVVDVASSFREEYGYSLNSGRVLDSCGNVLPSRIMSDGESLVVSSRKLSSIA